MGRPLRITINSIANGKQSFEDFPGEGQFLFSRAIDPDVVANLDDARPYSGGLITPIPVANQVTTTIDDSIIAQILPSSESIPRLYTITAGGSISRFTIQTDTLVSQTAIGSVNGTRADGAIYYNDYIYIFGSDTGTDVSRYGPLSGVPNVFNNYWGTTLGLTSLDGNIRTTRTSGTASTDYPTHWPHLHVDNAVYFADYADGGGILNKLQTDASGTNDGSAYNVLNLPSDYQISDIESYGNDLVISANKYDDVVNSPGKSGAPALFFWDTISESFYNQVELPEFVLVTALLNKGGEIYVFGGSVSQSADQQIGGQVVGIFDGSDGVSIIKTIPDGHPPYPAGVAALNNRISWGTKLRQEANRSVVYSIGSKSEDISPVTLQCGIESTLTAANENDAIMTSISYPFRSGGVIPRVVASSYSEDQDTATLDTISTSATQTSLIQFGLYNIGEPFRITKVRVPLSKEVESGVIITPSLLFDDKQSTYTLSTINNTNYPGQKNIVYKEPQLTNTVSNEQARGEHDFVFQLAFTGTVPNSVKFPITIELETIDD